MLRKAHNAEAYIDCCIRRMLAEHCGLAASRKRKAQELEDARRAEEELMEARRRELLSEENGYWRKRMAQEMQQRALAEEASTDANPSTVR